MTSHDLAAAADVTDPERRHGFGAAVAEYQRLLEVYPSLGYEVTIVAPNYAKLRSALAKKFRLGRNGRPAKKTAGRVVGPR
jgi:predicted transcriptional regulator